MDCQKAAEKDPLGFLTQLMHRAQRSQRGCKTPDWKVQVCSICYRPSHFINAGKRQAEAQLGKRCPLDRLRARIAILLTGPGVPRDLATVHPPSTSGRYIVTLLYDMGTLVNSVDQMCLLCRGSSTSSLWTQESIRHTKGIPHLENGNLAVLDARVIVRCTYEPLASKLSTISFLLSSTLFVLHMVEG